MCMCMCMCCGSVVRFSYASLVPLPCALLLAATYPTPPVLQPTSPRTQGANTPIGLVGHRIPHRSVAASPFLPSLPPSLLFLYLDALFPSSQVLCLPTVLSSHPCHSPSLSLSLSLFGMSLLPELPHATFVMCLGRGGALSMCGV